MLNLRPRSSLVDSMTKIIVAGLKPFQKITLGANIVGDSGEIFQSHAHYIADKHAEVDVYRDSSLGGSYSGVEPMGLLWSMKQAPGQKKGLRLFKTDVTKPYNIVLKCFDGHISPQQGQLQPLSSTTFQKWYMAKGVRRVPVRDGRIRGTLFLPPGEGPFPGRSIFIQYLYSIVSNVTDESIIIGGFHASSGDTNNNGEMNKCWWTNKAS